MVKKEFIAICSIYEKMISKDLYQQLNGLNFVELNEYEFKIASKLVRIPAVLSLKLAEDVEYKCGSRIINSSLLRLGDKYFIEIYDDMYSQIINLIVYIKALSINFQLNRQRIDKSVFDIDIDNK